MNKNFDDFIAYLMDGNKMEVMFERHADEDGIVRADLSKTTAMTIEVLGLYHKWLTNQL
jgi:hypothetical protein